MTKRCSQECGQYRVGFGRAVINPRKGISLQGYFNPRPNTGVLDDLSVKVMLVESDGVLAGVVSYDLCVIAAPLAKAVRSALRSARLPLADTIPLTATHTHTGPESGGILRNPEGDTTYLRFAARQTVAAMRAALKDLAPSEILVGSVKNNPFAFNRRYWMKDGTVATNPGKLNPNIVKPEGPVDREIGVLGVRRNGQWAGFVTVISNHGDTTCGVKVSADWHGHMERALQKELGAKAPVLALIAPAGNINHFDVTWDDTQYSYGEAMRIGYGYAEIVAGVIRRLQPLPVGPLRLVTQPIRIPFRKISAEQIAAARRTVKEAAAATQSGNITSEDIVRGGLVIRGVFAKQLLSFVKWAKGPGRTFDIAALAFGKELAISFLPGEIFSEIGLAIKKASPFKRTWVVELANGHCGYVPMKECFARGGYEILPVVGGGSREDTCDLIIREAVRLLRTA